MSCCTIFYFSSLLALLPLEVPTNFILSSPFVLCLFLTDSSLSINVTFPSPSSHRCLRWEWLCWLSEKAVLLSLSLTLCLCVCCLIKCNKRDCDTPTPPPTSPSLFLQPLTRIILGPQPPTGTRRMLNLHLLQTHHGPSFQYTCFHPLKGRIREFCSHR